MKKQLFITTLIVLLFSLGLFAQRPSAINPSFAVKPSNIYIADTTSIKIKKLQEQNKNFEEDNKKLHQELSDLKASLNSLATKFSEVQKDNGALKLVATGINNSLNSLQTNFNTLQTNYNTFTTNTYLNHYHVINGVAGNTISTIDNEVQLVKGTGDFKKLIEWAKKTGSAITE